MVLSGVGRLGRDVELRYLQDGTAVANLALAFNYGVKDPQTGNRPSQWVECALFGKQAEGMTPWLKKGGQVDVVIGGVHIENYTKQGGTVQSKLTGRVINIEFVSGGQAQSGSQPEQQHAPVRQAAAKPRDNFDDFNDDIPF